MDSAEILGKEVCTEDGKLVHLPMPPRAVCRAGTQVRGSCIAQSIPEEIWELVATHMSIADWARARGTSKTLSRLEMLSFAPPCMAAIYWAAAHWGKAEVVALTVRGWDNQELMQLQGVLRAAGDSKKNIGAVMQQVRHIALHLEAGSGCRNHFWLWGILGQSHTARLESLCIVCDSMVWLCNTPIPTLKHLRVEIKDQVLLCSRVRNIVKYCQQLETLTVCSDIHEDNRGCLPLDLAGLKRLRCLTLQMVMPYGLTVPPGCPVHFVCHNIPDASEFWDEGLGVACTSCHLVEMYSCEQAAGQSSLFECLQRMAGYPCPNLTVLKLTCSAVGSKEDSLVIGKCLPALRELEIWALEGLHLWVGASVSLESLTVCSEDLLHFEMEDLSCLLSGLKQFRYAFGRCCMVTHLMLWNLSEVREWISVEKIDGLTEMRGAWALEYSGVALETSGCRDHTCGTCIDCLRRKHLPVSDNAEWPFVGLFAE